MPYFSGPNGIREVADPGARVMESFNDSRKKRLLSDYFSTGQTDLAALGRLDPDAAQQIHKDQEQKGLAKMFSDIYAMPEGQRQGGIAALLARDPVLGQQALKTFDPRFGAGGESYTLAPGSKRFGPDGKVIAEVPFSDKPKYSLREFNGGLYYVPEDPMAGQPKQNSPAANSAFDQHIKPLMQREGGYVANDAGAGPTNFGINSRANPDVDVQSLTPDGAQQLYKKRYWDAIGGDSLPPNLQAGAFDAAVNMGPAKAQELLQASGGDPAKFDQLRMQHYERLAQQNPQKYGQYLPSWQKRVQETSAMGGMNENYQDNAAMALPAGAIPVPGVPRADQKQKFQARQYDKDEVAAMGLPAGTVAYTSEDGTPKIVNKPDARSGTGGEQPLSAGERAKIRMEMKDTKDALGMFKAFDAALGDIGKKDAIFNGADRGRLGTAYNNARSALRILYNTGVLQPGELPMLNQALQDPNAMGAILDPRSRPQIQAQLDELYTTIARQIENKVRSYPQLYSSEKFDEAVAQGGKKPAQGGGRTVARTGTQNGRKVVQYSDGSVEYAD